MSIWGGALPSCESLMCGLFLCRFQVTGQVEDEACALITKKGVFSEKCFIHNYWICQDSSTEDNVWMIIGISFTRKESATMEICIFPQISSHCVALACSGTHADQAGLKFTIILLPLSLEYTVILIMCKYVSTNVNTQSVSAEPWGHPCHWHNISSSFFTAVA